MKARWPHLFLFIAKTAKWAWLTVVVLIAYWLWDRDPPTTFLARPIVPAAHAGEEVQFDIPVKRELNRECSLRVTRWMVDANGTRVDMATNQEVNADDLREREAATPGRLSLRFPVPPTFPSGYSTVNTATQYMCLTNPTTIAYPIRQSYEWPFYVLPPNATALLPDK